MARTKGKKRKWSVVHPRAAGIDIGSRFHVVAVSEDLDAKPVRTFSTFTNDLHRLAEWLKGLGIATVAMESTGVYWIPAFEIVQARGVEVVLVNARDAKTVPGRKTDVNDAQWLQQLHRYGLLRGSFHPSRGVAALRAYLRHRERLLDYAAAHVQHMHKALTQMNVQLHHVVSDVTGATGLRIIRAIVSGNTDPEELARFRDVRCKASPETIREALVGKPLKQGRVDRLAPGEASILRPATLRLLEDAGLDDGRNGQFDPFFPGACGTSRQAPNAPRLQSPGPVAARGFARADGFQIPCPPHVRLVPRHHRDGRDRPAPGVARADAPGVQLSRDLVHLQPVAHIEIENPAHDGGLGLVDFQPRAR